MTGQSETQSDPKGLEDSQTKSGRRVVSEFVCSYGECKAVFTRMYRLLRHLRRHTGEKPFVCPLNGCNSAFTCQSYLNKHMKRPHNRDTTEEKNEDKSEDKVKKPLKKYICSECEKQFKSKFQLRNHCFQHFGQKPFQCNECEKRFAIKSKLKQHLKTHEGYVCGREGCDYKANKWSELRKHISDLHKLCLKCNFCDKMFKSVYNLDLHKETTHLNHKIVCTYDNCDKTYSKKSNLMAHIRSIHENQLFKCTQEGCELTFLHKKSLVKHLENHLKPKLIKATNQMKNIRRRVSKASEITGIELNDKQLKDIMERDLQFRNQTIN